MSESMAIDWRPLFKKYKGEWIALKDDEKSVIAHGKKLPEVIERSAKLGFENPLLFKVPVKLANYIG